MENQGNANASTLQTITYQIETEGPVSFSDIVDNGQGYQYKLTVCIKGLLKVFRRL